MTRREELERRLKTLSSNRAVWICIGLQLGALVDPVFSFAAIGLMLLWILITWIAKWATAFQLSALIEKEKREEADDIDFIRDRNEQIRQRMQAMLATAEARARFQRQGSREMFKGNCIDVSENP